MLQLRYRSRAHCLLPQQFADMGQLLRRPAVGKHLFETLAGQLKSLPPIALCNMYMLECGALAVTTKDCEKSPTRRNMRKLLDVSLTAWTGLRKFSSPEMMCHDRTSHTELLQATS